LGFKSFWMPLVVVLFAIGLIVYFSKRTPEVKLAAIWMVLPLLPHLSTLVFASDELVHDRYLYVPMVGIALLLAILVMRVSGTVLHSNKGLAIASTLVIGLLCASTLAQNRHWQNEKALWSSAAVSAPNSRMVHIALGSQAEQRQDLPSALQ